MWVLCCWSDLYKVVVFSSKCQSHKSRRDASFSLAKVRFMSIRGCADIVLMKPLTSFSSSALNIQTSMKNYSCVSNQYWLYFCKHYFCKNCMFINCPQGLFVLKQWNIETKQLFCYKKIVKLLKKKSEKKNIYPCTVYVFSIMFIVIIVFDDLISVVVMMFPW